MNIYQKTLFYFSLFVLVIVISLEHQYSAMGIYKSAPMVLTILNAAVFVFDRLLWKIPILHPWFVPNPNLNGTFKGNLQSSWVDPTTDLRKSLIDTFVVVRQTAFTIHIRLYTAESESISLSSSFIKSDDGSQYLMCMYRNEPKQSARSQSPIHYGSCSLKISHNHLQLTGMYWTDRKTVGDMSFSRISRDTNSHSFSECNMLINTQS
jgi:hypothetical protein